MLFAIKYFFEFTKDGRSIIFEYVDNRTIEIW